MTISKANRYINVIYTVLDIFDNRILVHVDNFCTFKTHILLAVSMSILLKVHVKASLAMYRNAFYLLHKAS